jgi:hypothetical protein
MIIDPKKAAVVAAAALLAATAAFAGGRSDNSHASTNGVESSAKGQAIAAEASSGVNKGTDLAKALCGIIGNDNCDGIGGESST